MGGEGIERGERERRWGRRERENEGGSGGGGKSCSCWAPTVGERLFPLQQGREVATKEDSGGPAANQLCHHQLCDLGQDLSLP